MDFENINKENLKIEFEDVKRFIDKSPYKNLMNWDENSVLMLPVLMLTMEDYDGINKLMEECLHER